MTIKDLLSATTAIFNEIKTKSSNGQIIRKKGVVWLDSTQTGDLNSTETTGDARATNNKPHSVKL